MMTMNKIDMPSSRQRGEADVTTPDKFLFVLDHEHTGSNRAQRIIGPQLLSI
jgi:hypothetical protein